MDDTVTRYTLDVHLIEPTLVGLTPEEHKQRVDAIMAAADRITELVQHDETLQRLLRAHGLQVRTTLIQK